ncbi:MAG: KUP/HAK/KT family potassium transporter, partial [Beijerinckiaceae bacterium]
MAQTTEANGQAQPVSSPETVTAGAPGHDDGNGHGGHAKASFGTLALGALGVVYGDIGTSPLYALKETVAVATGSGGGGHGVPGGAAAAAVPVSPELIFGVLSLILWSLILVVTVKYVFIILRADNNGEGGTLTLVALAQRALGGRNYLILFLGMAGAALFYGDAVITPAISVLSAVEGLKTVMPTLEQGHIMAIAVVILLLLFGVQSRGTGKVAAFFGPVMLVWFLTLAALGILHIADDPRVVQSINPYWGVRFMLDHPGISLLVLGTVCLSVTGAEALYADMGHFGRTPIQYAWLFVVFPCLYLNYLGQGAMVLAYPETAANPLFLMAPEWFRWPLLALAACATIIASQAVITGAFSLTQQAIQLGLLPRFVISHTSETTHGQIFMPRVNALLRVLVIALVLAFGTSSALANAYGISVFGAMMVDAMLAFVVIWKGWRFNWF